MIGAFFIPGGTFGMYINCIMIMRLPGLFSLLIGIIGNTTNNFTLFLGEVWMYFGMIGGFLFILIQLILIIDFAHSWAEAWMGNYEETDNKGWLAALSIVTGTFYAGSITAIGKKMHIFDIRKPSFVVFFLRHLSRFFDCLK